MKRYLQPLLVIGFVLAGVAFVVWRNGLGEALQPKAKDNAAVASDTPRTEVGVAPTPAVPLNAEKTPPEAEGQSKSAVVVGTEETLVQDLRNLLQGSKVAERCFYDEFLRRSLLWVVNSSSDHMKADFWPLMTPGAELKLKCNSTNCSFGANEQARYQPYVDALSALNLEAAVAFYQKYSEVFEKANSELGEGGHFRERLIKNLDLALKAPASAGALEFQPSAQGITYVFADEHLESLPYIQKVILRLSKDQRKRVQEKLNTLKTMLGALPK